jgi:hypothetical protein
VLFPGAGALAEDVHSPNPLTAVFEGQDYSARNDPKAEIRIVGTLGGEFCGQVVLSAAQPFKGAEARAGELKNKDGGVIPASAIRVSYAYPTRPDGKRNGRLDALLDVPRPDGKTHAVWITVKVPTDAKPGDYEGRLTVGPREVPVKLKVCGFLLPVPNDYITHIGLVQSPDSVALQYKKEPWSEEHFKLIGRSFEQMGRIGNKTVFIPLICQTNFGNEQSMVRWIKDGDKYKHDFTLAEKYLDLYIEKAGKPKVVCFYLWEIYAGGGYFGKDNGKTAGVPVTLWDPEGRKAENLTSPPFGTPESEAFWKPVLDGLHERLAKRGLGDETFMVGVGGDIRPGKAATEEIKKIAPYARWVLHSHGKANQLNGVPVGYISHVWGVGGPPPGWKQEWQYTLFPREGVTVTLRWNSQLGAFRMIGEHGLLHGVKGVGRIGADFWNVLGEKDKRCVVARYPATNWNQLNMTTATVDMLYPGPNGAASTARFEMLREGVQECEARISIEKALLDKALRAKLGEELAKKCEAILDERAQLIDEAAGKRGQPARGWEWYADETKWPERTEKLFSAAAEVARAAGAK